ncbi:AAA family ATPase, partial [Pelomonas sp. KK5]|uniref:ATP-binding protein n=1 Tax=Pelomonas sp. KK5 TaxID=1855730 RepID=UPI00117D94A6
MDAPYAPFDVWRLRLLGAVSLQRGPDHIGQLGSRSVASLLARLALQPARTHPREELIELLWPGVELEVGRNRLRQALFALRQLLEPPGPIARPVLQADRMGLRLLPGVLACDALQFEHCLRAGQHGQALELYAGELIPGFYDDWIAEERLRLQALFDRAPQERAPVTALAPVATASPPPRAPDHAGTLLPQYLTRFFGREPERQALEAALQSHRLVTLLGPGGSGKTRLAVDLAQRAAGAGFAPVVFVPLAAATTQSQLLDGLLGSLQLQPSETNPLAPLIGTLAERRALLVLDNFEQLEAGAAELLAQLLAALPRLHLLVTSRRVLGLDGEREFPLGPLALPGKGESLAEAAGNPAIALFVDRARAARADFQLRGSNLAALTELAHLLDGLPLAIELAAARVRSLAPAALAELLRESRSHPQPGGQALALLARSSRGRSANADSQRHASMQAVVAWSWRLLDAHQAALLAAITVFQGGFTAAAVAAICERPLGEISLRLDELVSHSLLGVRDAEGRSRYTCLEPVREFAAQQLRDEDARHLAARHRAWLIAWATALPATPSLTALRQETPNVLAALASALRDEAPQDAVRLVCLLWRAFEAVGLPAAGLADLARAAEACQDADLRGQGHSVLGALLFSTGRSGEAVDHAERGLALCPPQAPWRAMALYAAARARWRLSHAAEGVVDRLSTAHDLALAAGDDDLLARILTMQGFACHDWRDFDGCMALHQRALSLWQGLGNQHMVHMCQIYLANCENGARLHEAALERLAALEPGLRAQMDWRLLCQMLVARG